MNAIIAAVASLALLSVPVQTQNQTAVTAVTVIPAAGDLVTPSDVPAITSAMARLRSGPWLIETIGPLPNVVLAYAMPDIVTTDFRRGEAARVVRSTIVDAPIKWFASGRATEMWAQVAIEGRSFDDVRSVFDQNRPFAVDGSVSHDEVRDMVRWLRTRPPVTALTSTASPTPRWGAIVSVGRGAYANATVVETRDAEGFETYVVRRDGPEWSARYRPGRLEPVFR